VDGLDVMEAALGEVGCSSGTGTERNSDGTVPDPEP
jgi:hypothetical protein